MAPKRHDPARTREIFTGTYRRLRDWLVTLPDEVRAAPSVCAGWTVHDLASHIALVADAVARLTPGGRGAKPLTISGYVAGYAGEAADVAERTRSLAERTGRTADGLAAELNERFVAATATLDGLGAGDPVVLGPRGPIRLGDFLATRVIELVVHADDLARSVPEPAPPKPARPAEQLAVRALLDVLAERAPGRSVEVRVPPYAAVQCIPGPRHTRGTPPAVVETDPVTWLRLAAGREQWVAAVEAGRVAASGERTDLTPHLPVL